VRAQPEDWLEALAGIEDPEELGAFLSRAGSSLPPDASAALHAGVLGALYGDRPSALRLNQAAQKVAELRGDPVSRAWALRSQGHCSHVAGDYENAVTAYGAAAGLFDSAGMELELGRTLLGGLQALIFRGQYEEAHRWAARAEAIFQRRRDLLRLARLDSNVGNIYFRQDRPQDALARYLRALEGFKTAGEPRDIAAALSNLAVSYTNLGQFPEALWHYQRAREHCEEHGLANLAARADYNVAYLYYLRGEYVEARRLYQISRVRSQAAGDAYHAALCDLDEAEMYLELNLTREGEALAQRAVDGFGSLGMPYEQAKALVNLAVAASQRRNYRFANRTLIRARRLFLREQNPVWPALVDQLRAALAFHESRFDQARRLSASALRILTQTMAPGRAAHSQILLARLSLQAGHADRARAISQEALERLGENLSPSLRFHANMVQGEAQEMQGRWEQAMESYEAARREVEDLRRRVDTEDLRISILQDKLAVYEGLVALCLDSPAAASSGGARRALLLVQQAKSRSLADRLATPSEIPGARDDESSLDGLRRDLNLVYRQIDLAALTEQPPCLNRTTALREKARELETRLIDWTKRPQPADSWRPHARPNDIPDLQGALREGEILLEYYEARGILYLFLLSRESLEVARLGPSAPVHRTLKLLQFQLGKCRWAKPLDSPYRAGLDAASHHFRELYTLLLAPMADRLSGYRHLIVAPHRDLHALPFAALHDGSCVLVDRFTLSVIPSADVLARCRQRRVRPTRGSLVMAAPDPRAPGIQEEACLTARTLPDARLLLGEAASLEAFRRYAPESRIVHLAAHGVFRRDNPMFSALQLADSRLSMLELNRLRLNVELLTLSACSTGLTVAVGGDELLGLIRGFLQAGARSLLVTLWEIDDACTNEFMRGFYREVGKESSLAAAVQGAIREIRERYPHPYFWAPFLLIGEPGRLSHAEPID
jgi:tetratricopeptide (TPR) repeat protein